MDLLEETYRKTLGKSARRYAYEDAMVNALVIEQFDSVPHRDAVTFATTTVSVKTLQKRSDGSPIRQELLLACKRRYLDRTPELLLAVVARDVLESHFALRYGEVLGPAGPIFPGSRMEAFYSMLPTAFPPPLQLGIPTDPPTLVNWIFPIYPAEAWYIRTHGWEEFERICEKTEPNVLDFERPIIELCKEGYENRDH